MNQKKIFISWSGNISKKVSLKLKKMFEKELFANTGLSCFVSDVDIKSGTLWSIEVKSKLKECSYGILCVTIDNINSSWINFELGALVNRNISVVPMLINCNVSDLGKSPLNMEQCLNVKEKEKFINMIIEIDRKFKLGQNVDKDKFIQKIETTYKKFMIAIKNIIKNNTSIKFSSDYIFPRSVKVIVKNSIYIGTTIANLNENEFNELREIVNGLNKDFIRMGFKFIYSPISQIKAYGEFDGKNKAIFDNFSKLKQSECIIIIFPKNISSSVLVEIGYGISLSKKMVIFYNDELPFMLQEAGNTINNVKTIKYETYKDITKIINTNQMSIFETE